MNSIAAIILTFNEEKHIERCIRSLSDVCEAIYLQLVEERRLYA